MSEPAKGDPWIIAQLLEAQRRNRHNDNPNQKRGRMAWDFASGRVRIESVDTESAA